MAGRLQGTRPSHAAACKTRQGCVRQAVNGSYQQAFDFSWHMQLNFKKVNDLATPGSNFVLLPICTWISKHLQQAKGPRKHYCSHGLIPFSLGERLQNKQVWMWVCVGGRGGSFSASSSTKVKRVRVLIMTSTS